MINRLPQIPHLLRRYKKLKGTDRADYGDKFLLELAELAKRQTDVSVSNCNRRQATSLSALFPALSSNCGIAVGTIEKDAAHGNK